MGIPNDSKSMELLNQITSDQAKTGDMIAMGSEDSPLFGYLCAYTLGEARIPHDEAKLIWDARGIPIKPASHIDAFRRAITRYSTVEHDYTDSEGNTITCVFRIRDKGMTEIEGSKTNEYIWEVSYHEHKEARETQRHESLYQIIAYKKGKEISISDVTTKSLSNSASEHLKTRAEQIFQSIMAEFETLITNISNDQIRDTLIKAIKDKDGVPFVVGRGGAWFVPLKSRDFVLNVKAAIKDTRAYAHNKLDVRIIPVVKDDDLRASIAEDVENYAKQEFEGILRETLKKLEKAKNEDSQVAVLQDAISEKATLMGLKDRYENLLSTRIKLNLDDTQVNQGETPTSERVQTLIDELKGVD